MSRKALLAAGSENFACGTTDTTSAGIGPFPLALFITWTTYGAWLPGDHRGWRKWKRGERLPQPLLEDW